MSEAEEAFSGPSPGSPVTATAGPATVVVPAGPVPWAWRDRHRWALEAAGGALFIRDGSTRRQWAGPGEVTGARLVRVRPRRSVPLLGWRYGMTTAASGRRGLAYHPVRHDGLAVQVERRSGVPLVLPLDAWSGHVDEWGRADTTERRLTESGLRLLLAAVGVDDAWSFDLAAHEAPAADAARILDPRALWAPVAAVGWLLLAGIVLVPLCLLAALVARSSPAPRWTDDLLAAPLVWLCVTAGLAAVLTAWARWRAFRPVPGRALLPRTGAGVQLAIDGTDLVVVDAALDQRRLPIGSAGGYGVVTARAHTQEALGVRMLALEGLVRHHRYTAAVLPGDGWGDQPAVVDAAATALEQAGVPWEQQTVPRGSPPPTPATAVRGATQPLWSPVLGTVMGATDWVWVVCCLVGAAGSVPLLVLGAIVGGMRVTLLGLRLRDGTRFRRHLVTVAGQRS